MLAYPLFYKLVVPEQALVSRAAVSAWVKSTGLLSLDAHSRLMEVLAQEGSTAVTQVIFSPVWPSSVWFGLWVKSTGLLSLDDHSRFFDGGSGPRALNCRHSGELRPIWPILVRFSPWVKSTGLLLLDAHSRLMEVLAQVGSTAVTQVCLAQFGLTWSGLALG